MRKDSEKRPLVSEEEREVAERILSRGHTEAEAAAALQQRGVAQHDTPTVIEQAKNQRAGK